MTLSLGYISEKFGIFLALSYSFVDILGKSESLEKNLKVLFTNRESPLKHSDLPCKKVTICSSDID